MKAYGRDFRCRIPAALNEDLELWGRCAGALHRRPGVSMTYVVCKRLAAAAGVVARREHSGLLGIDLRRAELVERAWAGAALTMVEKSLLAGYYVYRVRPEVLCRALGVPLREFDDRMTSAACVLGEELKRLAGERGLCDNHGYN